MDRAKIISTAVLALVLTACGVNNPPDKNELMFESKKWKSGDLRTKGKMTENLLSDSLLIGKTKGEVLNMLGDPDQQTSSRLQYAVDPGIKYMGEPWTYLLSVDIDTLRAVVTDVRLAD